MAFHHPSPSQEFKYSMQTILISLKTPRKLKKNIQSISILRHANIPFEIHFSHELENFVMHSWF
jgi:hypothetical protein